MTWHLQPSTSVENLNQEPPPGHVPSPDWNVLWSDHVDFIRSRESNVTFWTGVERQRAQLEESVARYLSQLDTADRQEPTEAPAAKVTRLTEKLTKLKEEMGKLAVYEKQMLASPDQQISLTDPDSRAMATSGRGSGVVGYNVQVAVDTEHHLIVTHEVTNSGSDRAQLANMAKQAKAVLKTETLEAVADRGYFSSLDILGCHEAGITVTLPKPQTSGAKSDGRFGKQDFVYLPEEDAYRSPAGEQLPYRFTNEEDAKRLRATGPQPVKIVRLNRSARQGQSDGFRDGSMSICSKLCSSALMKTHKPCASVTRQSSIRSAQ
jgi:hypothetical protein